jgi:ketosteroid isomerase-like protein
MTAPPAAAAVVHAWLAAVDAGDEAAVIARTTPDVRLVGPRGVATGHDALRAWLRHVGATFETQATHAGGDAVVVAQRGVWRDAATGAVVGTAAVATRFRVAGGRVAEVERYDDPAAALRAAGLTEADAVAAAGTG